MTSPFNLAGELSGFFVHTDSFQQEAHDINEGAVAKFNVEVAANGQMTYKADGEGVNFSGLPQATVEQASELNTAPAANPLGLG